MSSAATRTVVLASASPARLALLRSSGIEPVVAVSGVDEEAVEARLAAQGRAGPDQLCRELAEAKATRAAEQVAGSHPGALVIGADSVLDLDGVALGKPADATTALARWHEMAGRTGVLCTGHAVIDLPTGRRAGRAVRTTVRFGRPDPTELAAYVATGEPLAVAGAFTLDGLGAPFVEGIDGDPSNVVGLSLPTLRALLAELGVRWTDLWA